MIITYSEPKNNFGISGKDLIASLGLNAKARPKKCKKERNTIGNISNKELLKNIKEFDELPYKSYERRRPKHETADSYFYLANSLLKV